MLAGRVAIVTGAARGIGQATARLFAEHGAKVALVDLGPCDETIDLIKSRVSDSETQSHSCDIADPSQIESLVQNVEAAFGTPCDTLVNCAGITRDGFLWKQTEEHWDAVLNTNLKGPFLLTQAVARRLLQEQADGQPPIEGAVVNISSIIGKVGNLGQTNYAASKAGLIGFTKSAAKDLARGGIRVNAILPGFIETPMSAAVPEKVMVQVRKQIPVGELGTSDDIAEAALFLASNKAKYVTGATLEVTGGLYM